MNKYNSTSLYNKSCGPAALWSIFILTLLLSACSVQMIAPYDQVTDEQTYMLQENVMIQFSEWQRNIGPVDEYYNFYDSADARLTVLIERNKQIPDSDYIVDMLERLHDNLFTEVRGLHEQDLLDHEVIEQIKPDIMAQFTAIQKFQMALKRSEN